MTAGPDDPARADPPVPGGGAPTSPGGGTQLPGAPVAPRYVADPPYRSPLGPTGAPAGPPVAPPNPPPAPARPAEPATAPPPVRPTAPVGAPPAGPPRPAARPTTVGAGPVRKGGRRARLTIKRIDPWSTLKFSFVYSLAGLVVLLVAVVALYAIVDAMGVIDSIRTFLNDVEGNKSGGSIADWLGFGRVMAVALVVGGVNVILFTAFATLTAFIYNVCTDLVGGIEVTLADRN